MRPALVITIAAVAALAGCKKDEAPAEEPAAGTEGATTGKAPATEETGAATVSTDGTEAAVEETAGADEEAQGDEGTRATGGAQVIDGTDGTDATDEISGAAARVLGDSTERSRRFEQTEAALREVAKAAVEQRVSPRDVVETEPFKALIKSLQPVFDAYEAGAPGELEDVMRAAVFLSGSDEPYERAAAYRLLDFALHVVERKRGEADEYRRVLAERFRRAIAKEKVDLIRVIADHPSGVLMDFLVGVATGGDAPAVRAEAVRALDRCPVAQCPMTAEQVGEWVEGAKQGEVAGALIAIGGKLRLPEVYTWCEGQLGDPGRGQGCRTALVRLRQEKGFDLLYEWLDAYKDDPASKAPGATPIGHHLALMTGFADRAYAPKKLIGLADDILGQRDRKVETVRAVANVLVGLKGQDEAKEVAAKHLRAYQRVWRGERSSEQEAALQALERAARD